MPVATFSPGGHTVAAIGDERFVLLDTPTHGALVVRDRCRHRGGPLRLGQRECGKDKLACPWHGFKVSDNALLKSAAPGVQIGSTVRALLPGAPEALRLLRMEVPANGA